MKIFVKAKLRAKEQRIKKIDDLHFEVAVKAPPVDGRANAAIIKALADHFGTALSGIEIISGHTSKQKIIRINNDQSR